MKNFAIQAVSRIRETVGDQRIIFGLSGGVDSSVTALLIHQAIGNKLTCIFVDNGLLRLNEGEKLKKSLKQHLNINIRFVSGKRQFLTALAGITDPEKKRKIIGRIFMDRIRKRKPKRYGMPVFWPRGHCIQILLNPVQPLVGQLR